MEREPWLAIENMLSGFSQTNDICVAGILFKNFIEIEVILPSTLKQSRAGQVIEIGKPGNKVLKRIHPLYPAFQIGKFTLV
jgi:hypothetical protein